MRRDEAFWGDARAVGADAPPPHLLAYEQVIVGRVVVERAGLERKREEESGA